ncbi:MAG: type II toxin-antitoxin system PemK/MazF family toxin [Polyangiaceae bacterium]|nr:type II toxin-antitoxin system PemK/MazF family toxin [Polyangiaceae bacterium]
MVWTSLPGSRGSAPAGHRPVLVLQHNRFNRTNLATAVVVAITSKLKYAELPGNVRLRRGEAGLLRASVVNVTQIATVDRGALGPKLGTLTAHRLAEVWAGVRLVCEPDVDVA